MRRIAIIVGLLPVALACNDSGAPRKHVMLGVQEVLAPTELALNVELVATITVITGGCKAFDRFVTSRSGNRLTVEARGFDAAGGQLCPDDIRYEPREYRSTVPPANPVVLAVRQPNGDEIVRQIHIR